MKYILLLLLTTISLHIKAQPENNTVSWDFSSKKIAKNEFLLILKAKVNKGWYIYSQYLESDDGPVRTELVFDDDINVKKEGKALEKGNMIDAYDNLFSMNIKKFKDELIIEQKIVTELKSIKGFITFMTCNDESCLPPSDVKFELNLK